MEMWSLQDVYAASHIWYRSYDDDSVHKAEQRLNKGEVPYTDFLKHKQQREITFYETVFSKGKGKNTPTTRL